MVRKFLIVIASIAGIVLIFIASSIIPIDRYDYKTRGFYKVMMRRLDSLKQLPGPLARENFSVGYSRVNLTPPRPTSIASYGTHIGKLYAGVHDSIYVRAIVIGNGSNKIAVVSADLLIIPPAVTATLARELPEVGFSLNTTYMSAVHSHNSIGNWGTGIVMDILYGKYNDTLVHFIADRIKESILLAAASMRPATIRITEMPLRSAVRNRLDKPNGGVDSLLHVVEIKRNDSSKLAMISYTAHATCIDTEEMHLSRDYPGKLVDELERNEYDFAMFMSGAVGSHAANAPMSNWGCVDWMADTIETTVLKHRSMLRELKDSTLIMYRVPLALGEAEVKISKNWRLRPWLFRATFGDNPSYLTVLRIGELVMLGTPCDYSGQLTEPIYRFAKEKGLDAMVTSFNGGYIGYITPNRYYDSDHDETRIMNWYGPGNGEYLQECMVKMIDAIADNK